MNQSVVIIGGGLGGLFTGAFLSKEGLRVSVIEKNVIPGGGLQSFRRFGEVFDTGMHVIGGMQKDGNIRRLCEYLGIWKELHIRDVDEDDMDEIFFAEDGRTYHLSQGKSHFIKSLTEYFPHQKENIKAYTEAIFRLADEVDLFYLRPSSDFMKVHSDEFQMAADAFIANYITDEHLQSLLAYLNPLYGGRKGSTPAYIHSLISVLYIDGASRFAGGSLLFAETLKHYIEKHGGKVVTGDPVTSIQSMDKLVTSVTTKSGSVYTADIFISAIHPCAMLSLLDDEHLLPKSYRNRLEAIPNSYSAFTLNIKLKKDTFRFLNHSKYYMRRYDQMWSFEDINLWPCGFLFHTPPEIVQGEYSDKLIITAPIVWSEVEKWADTKSGNRGVDYESWKSVCAGKLIDAMDELYPGFKDCIEAVNSASPLTIRDFYGIKEGSMYGFSKDCNNIVQSQVPVVTKVPNLFLTGQNCNLHGFCGVSLTAINTSEAILGRNHILDKINRFDDIRPYYEHEIPAAMHRIANDGLFAKAVNYLYPDCDLEKMRQKVECIDSTDEFQRKVMCPALDVILEKTTDDYSYGGIGGLDTDKAYLFFSNHRDIVLDASLLSATLIDNGFVQPDITFGANLMQGQFVIDVGKSNRMFRVERPGNNPRQFYEQSVHLSDYIRTSLQDKGQSIWIAQRNGRTKDGIDRTDQGIIKMFAMSGPDDRVASLSRLNIVPVAISYEWEPCDVLKAVELYKKSLGAYRKAEGEDMNSILTGLLQRKGRVHLEFCERITEADLVPFASLPANSFFRCVAGLIDGRICRSYRLFANNYIAHDLSDGSHTFASYYTAAEKEAFLNHFSASMRDVRDCDMDFIRKTFLQIYAAPVDSRERFKL